MSREEGYIKLSRHIRDWAWFDDPSMLSLWIHLLVMAEWKPRSWRETVIDRGEIMTSSKKLATEAKMDPRTVRACLKRLEEDGTIEIEKYNYRYIRIRIVKFDEYQGEGKS